MIPTHGQSGQAFKELELRSITPQERQQIQLMLFNILCYPDKKKAQIHHRSNNIGKNDLFSQQKKNQIQIKQNGLKNLKICQCCGVLTNNEMVPYCTNLKSLNIGIGVHMFFTNYLFHAFLFFLLFGIYSIYALVTNIQLYNQQKNTEVICIVQSGGCGLAPIGAGSKLTLVQNQNSDNLVEIQSYIGIGFVTIWGFLYFIKNYLEQKTLLKTQEKKVYASDFTLMLTHVPRSFFIKNQIPGKEAKSFRMKADGKPSQRSKPQFQYLKGDQIRDKFNKMMMDYGKQRGSHQSYEVIKVNIAKPLYDKTQLQILREKNQKKSIKKKLDVLRGFIEQRQRGLFRTPPQERQKARVDAMNTILKTSERKQNRSVDFADENVVFVTMRFSKALQQISANNRPPSLSNFWNFCKDNEFPIRGVKVRRAPPPQQIKWECIGFSKASKRLRRVFVWFLTIFLIGISLGINIGISSERGKQAIDKIGNNIGTSIGISVVISVINIGIQIVVTMASYLENQYIMSRQQSSIAVKVAFSQLVNSIGVPIIVTLIYYGNQKKKTWLGEGGLVDDIFFIALINVIVPITLFFDPWEIYLKIKRWWYSRPIKKLYTYQQKQLNKHYGNYSFDIGYQYAYLIKTSIFTAFFVCMQPIIAVMAPIGFILYFLATKRNFLRHFQRPQYHSSSINKIVDIMLLISLIAFGLGCLFVENFIQEELKRTNNKLLLLNWIIVAIGGFFMIVVPLRLFYYCFNRKKAEVNHDYKKQEPNITSDFDRLNPQTRQKAISQFKKLLQQFSTNKASSLDDVDPIRNSLILLTEKKKQDDLINKNFINLAQNIRQSAHRYDITPEPIYNNNLEDYKIIINQSLTGRQTQQNLKSAHQL